MSRIGERNWRSLPNREELFFRYLQWRLSTHDLDHSHYCKVLTSDLSNEQKCWFSLLFGMTYRTPQAYAYFYTFPHFDRLNLKEVSEWHKDNWKRTAYGTDARYNKGHFVEQVESIMRWTGEESLHATISKLTSTTDPRLNFFRLFTAIGRLYKYGRMTSWLSCQCLYDTLQLPIDIDDVLISDPNYDSSMRSIWNGYCMLKGRYSQLLGDAYSTRVYRASENDIEEARIGIMRYRDKAESRLNLKIDVFKWESIWCQFKRLFNRDGSKEYPGHASGDATSRYLYYREYWPEVDWTKFREALLSQPGLIRGRTYVNEYNKVFGATGLLLNMHEMFSDLPNAYEVLGIDPAKDVVKELFLDAGLEIPTYG